MLHKILSLMLVMLLLAGCAAAPSPTTASTQVTASDAAETDSATGETAPPTSTEGSAAVTAAPEETESVHSDLYIPGLSVEDVTVYFNEVCLDAEYANSGDASLLQRWEAPIYYTIYGDHTDEDMAILNGFTAWLNTIEGFPGIAETEGDTITNMYIHFCPQSELISLMGDEFSNSDGAVTFWYDDNIIYNARICCRTDIDQNTRNSVILEELYNGLGPIQDTALRHDSIIFTGFSTPQGLTEVDELIMTLLYHPDMACGMTAAECEQIIRQLYY